MLSLSGRWRSMSHLVGRWSPAAAGQRESIAPHGTGGVQTRHPLIALLTRVTLPTAAAQRTLRGDKRDVTAVTQVTSVEQAWVERYMDTYYLVGCSYNPNIVEI